MCTATFNVRTVTLTTGHLLKIDHRKLVKHGFLKPQDRSLTENSTQVFLPGSATNSQNSPFISVWSLDHYMSYDDLMLQNIAPSFKSTPAATQGVGEWGGIDVYYLTCF